MGKYEVGDKFVIEIDKEFSPNVGPSTLYRIKGFNALTIDEYGLAKLKRYVEPSKEVKEAVQQRIVDLTEQIRTLEAERDNLYDYCNEIEDRPLPF